MLMEYIKEERQNIFGQNEVDEDTKRKSTGVSYRQMLEEKRKKKSTGAAAVAPPPPAVAAAVAPPPPAAAAVTPPPPPAAAVAPPPPPPPAAAVTPPPPPPAAAVTPPPPPPVAATPPPPPPPPAAATPPPPPPPPVAVTPPPPPPPVAVTPPPPPPEVAAPKVVPSSSFDSTSLDASLECVQAVVTAYRVAPPGTIGLESLRNALASAVRKCEEALGMPSSSTSATGVSTSGETIEASVQAEASVEEMVTTAPIASPTKEVEETLTPTVLSPLEGDENFLALKNVYDKIAGASGREKYGLKAMDVDEAKDLADSLASFKSILLKELEEGVSFTPSDAKPVESEPVKEIPQETRGASTYEKMLAKARAKKELGA